MELLTTIAAEKDRLTKKRTELETELATVTHELAAIAAYEQARSGRRTTASKRDTVLAIIKDGPVTRAGIIEKLRAQGHDRPEAGVSNVLNMLKRKGTITADGGKYAFADA